MRLIDADALKRLVEEEWFDCKEKSSFFDEIDRTPTIELKRGKWKDIDLIGYKAICSECGVWSPVMGNYCPNCGALMERSEE